jgi:hypothetical protein
MLIRLGMRVETEMAESLKRYEGANSIKQFTKKTNKNGFISLMTLSSVLKYSLTVLELPS